MAVKQLRAKSFADFSKACWQSIAEALAPENSVKLNLNLNSDDILGWLVSRLGSTIVGAQLVDAKPILGVHNFRDSVGSGSKLFAAVSDGTNTDIYDVVAGTKSLEDDTKDLKTRFLTYLDSCLRLNGTDAPRVWNGSSWLSSISASFSNSLVSLSTASFTAAITDICTSNSHGLVDAEMIKLTTSGTLPAGLSVGTIYYVKYIDANTFYIYSDVNLTQIVDITDTGSGTHTWTKYTTTLTSAGHGLINGDIVKLSGTDLPLGLLENTAYYVVNKTTDTFQVSLTSGGTAKNVGDVGSGTLTLQRWDAFDLSNFPTGARAAIEFKDRVYAYLFADSPDKVVKSGIANSTTRAISWTVDNGFVIFEQEDGGGGITAGAKVPGYLLFWKKRTMKRFDGSSAYPEDMVNQGCPSQELVVVAAQTAFWINENGAWASQGGVPKKISSYTVDSIIKSCSYANLLLGAAGTDEEHIWWSLPSVTMNGETYTNVVLKYNILQNTFDVRQYPTLHKVYTKYVDSDGEVFTVFGDDDGSVLKIDTGNTDNGTPINWAMETQDITFGFRVFDKSVSQIAVVTENVSKASFMWRKTSSAKDWKPVGNGNIDKEVKMFNSLDLRAIRYNFKLSDTANSGQSIIKALEFPEGIKVFDSTN
jgi:hypothetical protein